MEIQGSYNPTATLKNTVNPYSKEGKEQIQESAQRIDTQTMMMEYTMQFQMNVTNLASGNLSSQSSLSALEDPAKLQDILSGIDYKLIGYEGKPLNELTQEEAKGLIAEDGFFGVAKTSERLADFVLQGAGGDLERLQKGREGILRGYEQAEKLWGGKLPEISQETLQKTLERIDQAIAQQGGNILSEQA